MSEKSNDEEHNYLNTIEEESQKRKKAEEESSAQAEIIRLLVEEKQKLENQNIELRKVGADLDRIYLPGERESLNGNEIKRFNLFPERQFENDAASNHFRTAESQFHRLLSVGTGYRVKKSRICCKSKTLS